MEFQELTKNTRIKMAGRSIVKVRLDVTYEEIVEKNGLYAGMTTPIINFLFTDIENPLATLPHVEYAVKHQYSTNNSDPAKAGRVKTAEELTRAIAQVLTKVSVIHSACVTNPRYATLLEKYRSVVKAFAVEDNMDADTWLSNLKVLYKAIVELLVCTKGMEFDFLPAYEPSEFVDKDGKNVKYIKPVVPLYASPTWLAKTGTGVVRPRKVTYDMLAREHGIGEAANEAINGGGYEAESTTPYNNESLNNDLPF